MAFMKYFEAISVASFILGGVSLIDRIPMGSGGRLVRWTCNPRCFYDLADGFSGRKGNKRLIST